MQTTHHDRLALWSHNSRGTNTNIILLLNLAAEAEKSGFSGFAHYLLQEAYQKLEHELEGWERELERDEKVQGSLPNPGNSAKFLLGKRPKERMPLKYKQPETL